jgi:hypothetical protein
MQNLTVYLLCRCGECLRLTSTARYELPRDTGLLERERRHQQAQGRNPFIGPYSSGAPWCECVAPKEGAQP